MTGKELVIRAINNETTERTPYVPFVGVHAASLLGVSAEEYLKSRDRMIEGVSKAVELYDPDGLPVVFDLQIEAEILGCNLIWADDNPPAVSSHALKEAGSLDKLPQFDQTKGRIPMVLEVTRAVKESFPDVALYGLITGPFTLSLHLMGPEIFMAMYDDPDRVQEIMAFCTEIGKKMAGYYIENGVDVIAVVDPLTSQISPDDFKKFVTEYCTDIFRHTRERGKLSSFFVCGHAQKNVEAMCQCRPDNISIDENIPLDYVRDTAERYDVSFGGNMRLTTVMLFGDEKDNLRHAAECIQIGGNTGFILAPGCDIPYGVPKENIIAVSEMVKDEYKRQIAMELVGTEEVATSDLDLSEYGGTGKIKVDIITLDSEACAPCQYMVESVQEIAPEFEGVVEWVEHKIKTKEAIELMTALNVEKVPTICIDGEVAFISQIPKREDLFNAIYRRMIERARIKKSDSKLIVLLDDSEESEEILKNISRAQRELGTNVEIEESRDQKAITKHGVKSLPAVFSVKKELKSFGKVADKEVIKEWLKTLM